jgi:cation transport regulator ChaB
MSDAPYTANAALPASLQSELSVKEQAIYRDTYNLAWSEYSPNDTEKGEFGGGAKGTRPQYAHERAMAAVDEWRKDKRRIERIGEKI